MNTQTQYLLRDYRDTFVAFYPTAQDATRAVQTYRSMGIQTYWIAVRPPARVLWPHRPRLLK